MESVQLSAYDFVVIGIILLLVGRGVWLGLLRQVVPLVALYFGYFAASRYHDQLFPFLRDFSDNPKVVFLSAYAILFGLTYLLAMLLGKLLAYVIQVTITPWFDRLLGALLGFAKALILVVLIHMILGTLLAPENEMLRTCTTCPTLNKAVDLTRQIIKDPDVREALKQQTPAISLDRIQELLMPEASADSRDEQVEEMSVAPEQSRSVE